ncbi:hypothetical protein ALC57_03081 [Trachymyrmex cornetzi]|uniref:C2H2-type domain-containing protein n=1 Tax=Trachymyrmex cornetzi TaxID=471704 RepID=A0A151JML7_9HYME|nr:hypothetical protein ALC57_03081 [Trachymyrmex cornetzi]
MYFFQCNLYDELIRHYLCFHKYNPQFMVQCNYQGCGATYRKWKSFKQHLQRRHSDTSQIFDNFNEDINKNVGRLQEDTINQENINEQCNNEGKV